MLTTVAEVTTWNSILQGLPAAAETTRFVAEVGIGQGTTVQHFRITAGTTYIVVAENGAYPAGAFLTVSGVYLAAE